MRCTQCAAASFSAAARTLVERGDRCPQCGGELVLVERELPQTVGVSVAESPGEAEAREARERARRFEHD
jgi:uncharacterized protein with PIN domain